LKAFLKNHWSQILCVAVLTALAFWIDTPLGYLAPAAGMAISFSGIPTTLRVPSVAAEFDSSRAAGGPAILAYRALIIGQKTSAGTATADTLVRVTNASQAATYGGAGSMLHRQAMAWFASNKTTEVYLGVLDDNGAGVLATKTITFAGTATAAGTLSLYVGNDLVSVAVASGTTNTALATAVEAALDAVATTRGLPVVASVASDVVTLTAKNKGAVGQDLSIRLNYQLGESTPAGITVTIANAISGATNPVLTTLIAAMGDVWFHVIVHPYTDATSLSAIEAELVSRFAAARMIDGVAITSALGSASVLGTLGDTRNSPHSCIVAQAGETPITPPSEFAAEVGAIVAYYSSIDPARPHQTLPMVWSKAPAESDLFTDAERNLMLYDGIATTKADSTRGVKLERIITTYQRNAAGGADTAYLDSTTLFTLMYLRYSFRARILAAFPRHKLADDGTRFGAGQAVVTPKLGKAEAFAWFRQMEELGLVEDFDTFKTDLVVERNVTDPNRLDFLLPPDLINQFVIGAISVQFRL
jgi:phage tail sheath gpL-like